MEYGGEGRRHRRLVGVLQAILHWAPGDAAARRRWPGHRRRPRAERSSASSTAPAALPRACRRRPPCAVVHDAASDAGLVEHSRIIMEKPFGTDLASARKLNHELHQVFDEDQIFRIDHFLGKEAAQNILAFRFANGLFEPIWHRNHIDHVQIDVPEELGLGPARRRSTSAPAPTATWSSPTCSRCSRSPRWSRRPPWTRCAISEEKNKVFRSMLPIEPHDVVRGQYVGYRDIDGRRPRLRDRDLRRPQVLHRQLALGRRAVLPAHRQAAGRGRADHLDRLPRAAALDVPARLGRRRQRPRPPHLRPRRPGQDVAVVLRQAPGPGHEARQAVDAVRDARHRAGRARCSRPTSGSSTTRHVATAPSSPRAEGIERLWEISTPILDNPPIVRPYSQGSWGPNQIHQLIAPFAWRLPFERQWRNPNEVGG